MKKTFLTLSVLSLISTFSLGNRQSPQAPPPPAPPAKAVGKAQVFKEPDLIRVNVDFLLLGSMRKAAQEDVFQVSAGFSVPGEKITRPKEINLLLFSHSHGTEYRYKDDHQVEIWVDDKVIVSGPAKLYAHNIYPGIGVLETYKTAMPFEALESILNAKTAKLKFGKTTFDFNAVAITALKDLQRTVEQ